MPRTDKWTNQINQCTCQSRYLVATGYRDNYYAPVPACPVMGDYLPNLKRVVLFLTNWWFMAKNRNEINWYRYLSAPAALPYIKWILQTWQLFAATLWREWTLSFSPVRFVDSDGYLRLWQTVGSTDTWPMTQRCIR